MAWVLWLSAPIGTTALAAIWVWWRGRPARPPGIAETMRRHDAYLAALVTKARGSERTPPAEVRD